MSTDTTNTTNNNKDTTTKSVPASVTHRGDDETERMIIDKDSRGHVHSDQRRRKPSDRMKKFSRGHRLETRYELKSLNAGRGRMRAPVMVEDDMRTELEGTGPEEVDWEGVFGDRTMPWRAQVDLEELIVPSKPRKGQSSVACATTAKLMGLFSLVGAGDFEMVPRTRDVLAMDDDELMSFYQEAFGDAPIVGGEDEWEWLDGFDVTRASLAGPSYAAVVGQG